MRRRATPSTKRTVDRASEVESPTDAAQGSATNPVVASLETVSENPCSAVALSPCNQFIVMACKDTLKIIQVGSSGLHLLKSIIMSPFFTDPKARGMAGGGPSESLSLRSFAFGSNQQQPQPTSSFMANVVSITDVAWSPKAEGNSWIAVAGSSGAICIWSAESLLESATTVASPTSRSTQQARLPVTPEAMLQQHTRAVNSLAWHPSRSLLLSASQDGTTLLWESTSIMAPERRSNSSTKTFQFFGKVEMAQKQYRWNRKASFATKGDSILDVKWSPHHEDLFAGVTSSGSLLVYNSRFPVRALIKTVAHAGTTTSLDWHPTRPNVVATGGSSDRCVKIWHVDPDYQGGMSSDAYLAQNSSTIASRGADSVATNDSSGNDSQGAHSTILSGPVTILHRLAIAASVTRLRWRPPAPESIVSLESRDRHDSMIAVATAPLQGGAAGGSGLLGLWSFHRPFMALSVVEGHTDGAVTDFVWLDTPKQQQSEQQQGALLESTSAHRRKVVDIPEVASRLPGQSPHETDSIIYDNSDRGDPIEDRAVGLWQHVLSVGRDGRCLIQSLARGDRPISRVPPSCFAMANLTPLQEGYGSLQVFFVRQTVPSGPTSDFLLTGLRKDSVTDSIPGVFRETPAGNSIPNSSHHSQGISVDTNLGRRLPESPPLISFHVIDKGSLDDQQKPIVDPTSILVSPEVMHMSRFAERYKLYPETGYPTAVELCNHNADVAHDLQQQALAYMWRLLSALLEPTGGKLLHEDKSRKTSVLEFVLVPTVCDLLEERADAGDVQTCVAICEILRLVEGETVVVPGLELKYVREWYLSYIQLLQGMSLFRPAAHLVKMSRDPLIGALNQQATTIYESCPHCRKPLTGEGASSSSRRTCPSCRRRVGLCCVCHEPVQGLYVWCAGCGHGGHLMCLRTWFREWSNECPTGCGHVCNGNYHNHRGSMRAFPRTDSMEDWENGQECAVAMPETTALPTSATMHGRMHVL